MQQTRHAPGHRRRRRRPGDGDVDGQGQLHTRSGSTPMNDGYSTTRSTLCMGARINRTSRDLLDAGMPRRRRDAALVLRFLETSFVVASSLQCVRSGPVLAPHSDHKSSLAIGMPGGSERPRLCLTVCPFSHGLRLEIVQTERRGPGERCRRGGSLCSCREQTTARWGDRWISQPLSRYAPSKPIGSGNQHVAAR